MNVLVAAKAAIGIVGHPLTPSADPSTASSPSAARTSHAPIAHAIKDHGLLLHLPSRRRNTGKRAFMHALKGPAKGHHISLCNHLFYIDAVSFPDRRVCLPALHLQLTMHTIACMYIGD
ncbi:MAG: hypothetical protein WBX22_02740 [Silvibacterium sp.]